MNTESREAVMTSWSPWGTADEVTANDYSVMQQELDAARRDLQGRSDRLATVLRQTGQLRDQVADLTSRLERTESMLRVERTRKDTEIGVLTQMIDKLLARMV